MKKVYLDNASTTQIRPEVIQEMINVMTENYGNPSSSHSFGRTAKNVLELSRKLIAKQINASAQEIIFTSGGTEANNWIIQAAVKDLKIERIISSKIEHHAVLHPIEILKDNQKIQVNYVNILANGMVDLTHLVELLSENIATLVSLMHVNNEIGTVLDLKRVGIICKEHNAFFHSDCVQSIGKTEIDLQQIPLDFLVASAHKFHGPKGIGFAFIRKGISLNPIITGGEQEKGRRAGTENSHSIVGMSKALELANQELDFERSSIKKLKDYCIEKLLVLFPELIIVGNSKEHKNHSENVFYNIINVILPIDQQKTAMLLFTLDMKGIAVSRGSACQSGSNRPSHVLAEILSADDLLKPNLRISFSHFNTKDDIDCLIEVLQKI